MALYMRDDTAVIITAAEQVGAGAAVIWRASVTGVRSGEQIGIIDFDSHDPAEWPVIADGREAEIMAALTAAEGKVIDLEPFTMTLECEYPMLADVTVYAPDLETACALGRVVGDRDGSWRSTEPGPAFVHTLVSGAHDSPVDSDTPELEIPHRHSVASLFSATPQANIAKALSLCESMILLQPDRKPDEGDYDDMESAETNGVLIVQFEAGEFARQVRALLAPTPENIAGISAPPVSLWSDSIDWSTADQREALEHGWQLTLYDGDGQVIVEHDDEHPSAHFSTADEAAQHVEAIARKASARAVAGLEVRPYQLLCAKAWEVVQANPGEPETQEDEWDAQQRAIEKQQGVSPFPVTEQE